MKSIGSSALPNTRKTSLEKTGAAGVCVADPFAAAVIAVDRWVSYQASERIITSYDQVRPFDVAVVLGTSKYIGKTLNSYYTHRIEAAIELYRLDKVQHFC